jgi:glycerate kinase
MPVMISKIVLVLAESFGGGSTAARVAGAIGRGLEGDGRLECDLCPLDTHTYEQADERLREPSKLLDELAFDRRMRAARAVVIARERLDDRTLAGSITFEAATRARQAGVPAYAVTGCDELDPFEARIVDLQVILQARTSRALSAAGRKLAAFV